MIKLENTEVFGFEVAIRGMRNPMNSWDKSDSYFCNKCIKSSIKCSECPIEVNGYDIDRHYFNGCYVVGENDLKLMKSLSKAGNDHSKFLRMINVTVDITAPLYWWKEFDTYKVGTVANSCSTMHKIHAKKFELDDFSHEHLLPVAIDKLTETIELLNNCCEYFVNYDKYKDEREYVTENVWFGVLDKKEYWWQMIQLLPSSYNQKRTVQLNYQVLKSMYFARRNHKLDEWHTLCKWMKSLPYFKEICIDG